MDDDNKKEKEIIELFKQLPKMKDERPKTEIYRNVKYKSDKKQRKPVLIPIYAIAAALLFFIVAVPLLFQQSQSNLSMEKSTRENDIASTAEENANISLFREQKQDNNASELEKSSDKSDLTTAVYDHENNNGIATFGVVTGDAIAIPISIQTEWDEKKDWLANYRAAAQKFDPEAYGFKKFALLIDAMNYNQEEKTVYVTISPENKEFFIENEMQLSYMVDYTVRSQDVKQVKFVDEKNQPVELGEFGVMQPQNISILKKPHYQYEVNGREYIVPADLTSESLTEAVSSMKLPPNNSYTSLILNGIDPIVKGEEKEAIIGFKETLYLDEGDSKAKVKMIEGMLFTAKEFGFDHVQFENIEPERWEEFDFSNPVPVPTYLNLLEVK